MSTTLACFTLLFVQSGVLYADVSSYGVLSFGQFRNQQMYPWCVLDQSLAD